MTDIRVDEKFQPIKSGYDELEIVQDHELVMQTIRIEAATTEGEFFYDPGFGWSLVDFIQSEISPINDVEIKQRIRERLGRYDEVDRSSINIEMNNSGDIRDINVLFRFTDGETGTLGIILNRYEIEVKKE